MKSKSIQLDSQYLREAQQKFDEQNNYVLSVDAEQASNLVYDKKTKKYILVKNNG